MCVGAKVMGDSKAKEALFKNFFGAVKACLREDATGSDAVSSWRAEDKALEAKIEQAQVSEAGPRTRTVLEARSFSSAAGADECAPECVKPGDARGLLRALACTELPTRAPMM